MTRAASAPAEATAQRHRDKTLAAAMEPELHLLVAAGDPQRNRATAKQQHIAKTQRIGTICAPAARARCNA